MDHEQYIALRSQITGLGVRGLVRLTGAMIKAEVQGLNTEGVNSSSCIVYIIHRDGRVLSSPLIRTPLGYMASINAKGRISAVAVVGQWNKNPAVLLLGCSTGICFDAAHIKTIVLDCYTQYKPTLPMPEMPMPEALPKPMAEPAPEEMPIEVPGVKGEELMPSPQGRAESVKNGAIEVSSYTDAQTAQSPVPIVKAEFVKMSKPEEGAAADSGIKITFNEPAYNSVLPSEVSEYNEGENPVQKKTVTQVHVEETTNAMVDKDVKIYLFAKKDNRTPGLSNESRT